MILYPCKLLYKTRKSDEKEVEDEEKTELMKELMKFIEMMKKTKEIENSKILINTLREVNLKQENLNLKMKVTIHEIKKEI
jgi:hypothetical protein